MEGLKSGSAAFSGMPRNGSVLSAAQVCGADN